MIHRLTDWLLARFIHGETDQADPEVRAKYGFFEGWFSIIGNLLLSAVKFFLGYALNSVSLLADAVHTLSDVITSAVVIVGFHTARKSPDKEHPFGHGRIEFVATLVIALLLALVGVEFARSSISRLLHGNNVSGSVLAGVIMLFSGVAKEVMARIAVDLGQRSASSAILADAWHHRSDAIASFLVAIAMIAARYGYPSVDAVFGLIVSGLIIYTAWQLGCSAGSILMGEAPTPDLVEEIVALALGVEGVLGVHDVAVHDYGALKAVSLHIVVDQDVSFAWAHQLAVLVEGEIRTRIGGTVVVHVDPTDVDEDHDALLLQAK
jgi:cation diffusion facilitator family transporter